MFPLPARWTRTFLWWAGTSHLSHLSPVPDPADPFIRLCRPLSAGCRRALLLVAICAVLPALLGQPTADCATPRVVRRVAHSRRHPHQNAGDPGNATETCGHGEARWSGVFGFQNL